MSSIPDNQLSLCFRLKSIFYISLISFCLWNPLIAQSSDELLAKQFMQDEEYEKALPLCKSLWQNNYKNATYYNWLLDCYIHENEWDKARSVVKKTKKKNKANEVYEVDLLYLDRLEKNDPAVFETYVDDIPKKIENFQASLEALERRRQTTAIVRLLERAEFIFGKTEFFGSKLTNYYMALGQKQMALERIVLQLGNPFVPLARAKNIIEMNVTDSNGFIMLRDILLKELQTKPNSMPLNELLNWSFVQLQDWQTAYIFNKSLDARLQSKGGKLYQFGKLCLENLEYTYAKKAFDKAAENGETSPYFYLAISGSIEAEFLNILSN